MPTYRYRCDDCGHEFDETHGVDETALDCPACESENLTRLIQDAPAHHKGMLAHPGDGRRATSEQLRDKWREETPKLRKKLRDKLGDDAVKNLPLMDADD